MYLPTKMPWLNMFRELLINLQLRRSIQQCPEIPSPDGRGWTIDNSEDSPTLQIDWCDLPPAPESMLELMHCTCKKSKCKLSSNYVVTAGSKSKCCAEISLRCTQLCTCVGCDNLQEDSMSDEDLEDDVDSEADE